MDTTLQKWEGVVLEVLKDSFIARLCDLSSNSPDLDAEIFTREVSPEDLELLQPQAIFYWNIGYSDHHPVSEICFDRSTWTEAELFTAAKQAETLRDRLGWL